MNVTTMSIYVESSTNSDAKTEYLPMSEPTPSNFELRAAAMRCWPEADWQATCRRMQLCLARKSLEAAIIALTSFHREYIDGKVTPDSPVTALEGFVGPEVVTFLQHAGYENVRSVMKATDLELTHCHEIGQLRLRKIRAALEVVQSPLT